MSLYANGWREPIPGPRIERLRAELRTGDRDALLAEFWAEVERSGAPLVADIPGDPDAAAVTFLWRDPVGGLDHVALGGGLVLNDHGLHLLRRVPGTDVLAHTLRLPRRTRVPYAYGIGIPLGTFYLAAYPWLHPGRTRDLSGTWVPDPLNPAPRLWDSSVLDLDPDSDPDLTGWLRSAPVAAPVEHRTRSAALGAERTYWVHMPTERPENVVWSFDGRSWSEGHGALQNFTEGLTASRRIGPTAIVFIDSPPERRQRDMFFDVPFADHVRDELVPEVRSRYDLPLEPAVNVLSGYSGGGGATAFHVMRAPHIWGRALVGAGSVAYVPYGGNAPREFFDAFRADPPRGVRFALTIGLLDVDRLLDIPSLYDATYEFAETLAEVGIEHTIHVGPHGHDLIAARLLLARALPALLAP